MPEQTPRDPLDLLTVTIVDAEREPGESGDGATIREVAAAILSEGWRPPARVITDPAELDTLPVGSVVLDAREVACTRGEYDLCHEPGDEMSGLWKHLALPATVLHTAENGDGQ